MLDERSSSLSGIVILIVSIFFVPNSAFANGFYNNPVEVVIGLSYLISIVVVPLAFVYLGIVSLKHFNPNLGNYIHGNRLLKIGFYFLAEGLTWVIYRAITIQDWSNLQFYYYWSSIDMLMLLVIPGILLISIGVTKNRLSKLSRRTRIIFLIVGIGAFFFAGIFNNGYITILAVISITVCVITSIYIKVKKKDYTQKLAK